MRVEPGWKKIMQALTKALKAEVEGQNFYLMAADQTRDARARKVFRQLAREEKNHELFLWAQYQSILEKRGPDAAATMGSRSALTEPGPIFSPEFADHITSAHFEVAALAIALRLELRAVKLYREAAEQTQDPMLRTCFEDLARWEAGHRDALTRQLDDLRLDYWSTGGFTPL
jgi:rubrerythrin